ncbi:hypothetical protein JTB14_000577 [Gonioctena quinquepunctata]|nr:hypothetical protein JTB14_000577 [Gonioctena quinquepunctata]
MRVKMPKQKDQKVKSYSNEDIEKALLAIHETRSSVKKASVLFNIPRTTLISRLKGLKNRKASTQDKAGRRIDLGKEVDDELVDDK